MKVLWQIAVAFAALQPLLLMSVVVYYGVGNWVRARRLAPEYDYDLPAARPSVLVRLIAGELVAVAIAVFCLWCIFW